MTPSRNKPCSIPREVTGLLARLRRRIRTYVWTEGIAAVFVVLGIAFWGGLGLDWFFEPSPGVRLIAVIAVGVVLFFVAYRLVLRRAFTRLADASLALLVERQYASLQDSLLTSVELTRQSSVPQPNPDMMRHTCDDALEQVADVRLSRLFNFRPLLRVVAAAVVLVVSIVVFGLVSRDTFGFWVRRIALSEDLWPRRVSLSVVDFESDPAGRRVKNIARDAEYELIVRASLRDDFIPPREVEIRYRTSDGQRGRDMMIQVGTAMPGHDRFQTFEYTFKNVATDLKFDVVGGDDRVRDLHLNVVDRPDLIAMRLHCEYPAYMDRPPETQSITGTMRVPEGTRLKLEAKPTKPLALARLRTTEASDDVVLHFNDDAPATDIAFSLPPLSDDTVMLLSLLDRDGVRTREPIRVAIAQLADLPPEVAVRLDGVGMTITPDARIPFVGMITDPRYGLAKCWFECQVDAGAVQIIPFSHTVDRRLEIRVDEALDARVLDTQTKQRVLPLSPGQELSIQIKASDRYDLSDKPHVGSSPPFTLDIVTPDKLRALLERRELSLRQRFESLVDKTADTRRLLARVEFGEPNPLRPDEIEAEGPDNRQEASEQRQERHRLRIVAAKQNMAQVAQETSGVAESFDQIQAELVNNRIDTEQMLSRLRDQIAEPLRKIAGGQIPVLENQLDVVQSSIDDAEQGSKELQTAIAQTDAVLVAMQRVLDKMLELENYNEVLDLLRNVIEDQKRLEKQTKKKQRERLRGLID